MKKSIAPVLLSLLAVTCARADTSLTINSQAPFGCLQNAYLWPNPITVTGIFTLSGASGTGLVQSGINASAPTFSYPPEVNFFNYSIDLSGMSSPGTHCLKLVIHFGEPQGCDTDEVWGDPAGIQSATLAPFGDITLTFAGGCLALGQPAVTFTMFSEAVPKTNVVTILDDYVNPASGTTNETRVNVMAVVPDIPPNPPPWVFYHPAYAIFQGSLDLVGTNQVSSNTPSITKATNGLYDFTLQLVNSFSNGLAASPVSTQTVQVVNGLFNLPLPFEPVSMGDGSVRWLRLGVRPSGVAGISFTPLGPPLPITPTPQALYAYSAGVVADLTPGQAVTSLNGLSDVVTLQSGSGIILGTNGNALTISAQPGVVSDRSLKTDFAPLKPEDVLAKLVTLPIQRWRYTNEVAGIHHIGPMAQDFRAAFGVGNDDKFIAFVDEEGVALAAIQGLAGKVESGTQKSDNQIQKLEAENATLKHRLELLEQKLEQLNQKLSGGAQ